MSRNGSAGAGRRGSSVAPKADDVEPFLSPRVIDQGAFDELASTLRTLIDDANAATDRLDDRIRTAERAADVPDAVTCRIQERLRLGARLMQALQSQLEGADAAASRLEELRNHVENASGALTMRAEELGLQLDERVRAAAGGMVRSEQLAQAIARRAEAAEQRVQESARAAEEASNRATEVTSTMAHGASEAIEIVRQCQEARSELGGALLAGAARIDEMTGRGEAILEGIEERLAQAEAAADRLASTAEALEAASSRVEAVARTCGRLEVLLERLAPWERFLLDAEVDASGLPRPAAQMVEALRTGIGTDMARLSATMRALASRVDAFDGGNDEGGVDDECAPAAEDGQDATATFRFQA